MCKGLKTLVLAALFASLTAAAFAGDAVELRLKDGSRWKGRLQDQVELTALQQGVEVRMTGRLLQVADWYVTMETSIAGEVKRKTIFKDDILAISTVTSTGAAASADLKAPARSASKAAPSGGPADKPAPAAGKPGVFVLPLREMVGIYFRHEEMEAIAEEADRYGPGQIIILEIDSGGGSVAEMEKIHDTLTEIKKRHRLVAWIKKAISAACATAMHCDEIYFTSTGTAGAMTAFNGATGQAWSGEEMEEWMRRAGDWMEAGGRSRYIAEAMIHAPNLLSYSKDPVTGEVTFYNNLSGEVILSRNGENLVFTAGSALDCGFSDGTADTEEQLARLLDLGEWYETSEYGRRIAQDWYDTVKKAQREVRLLIERMGYAGSGSGDPVEVIGARIQIIEQIIRWQDRAPNALLMMNIPPKDDMEREVQELRKQLADMKKARR